MAKGDFLEPLFETTFKFATHIFYPRVNGGRILDELSYSWAVALALALFALHMNKKRQDAASSNPSNDLDVAFVRYHHRIRLALWALSFQALFMFRFASWF